MHLLNKPAEIQLLKSEWRLTQHQPISQQEMARLVLAACQNERKKIAHQIQEDLNQVLIAALLYLELAKTDDESREMCLEKAGIFVATVIRELTSMSRTLEIGETIIKKVDL